VLQLKDAKSCCAGRHLDVAASGSGLQVIDDAVELVPSTGRLEERDASQATFTKPAARVPHISEFDTYKS